MWVSAPTRVMGPGIEVDTGPSLIPSRRGRRPRRPASTSWPAPAERERKGIRDFPGLEDSPGASRFIGTSTRNGQPSPAGGRRDALARTDPPKRFFLLDRPLRSRWRLCRLRMRRTPCGCGPFVSGLSAAAYAAVGLRHAPAGAVFSARQNGVPARAQRSGSRGERRSKGSGRSFRIGVPAAPRAVGRAGAAE